MRTRGRDFIRTATWKRAAIVPMKAVGPSLRFPRPTGCTAAHSLSPESTGNARESPRRCVTPALVVVFVLIEVVCLPTKLTRVLHPVLATHKRRDQSVSSSPSTLTFSSRAPRSRLPATHHPHLHIAPMAGPASKSVTADKPASTAGKAPAKSSGSAARTLLI